MSQCHICFKIGSDITVGLYFVKELLKLMSSVWQYWRRKHNLAGHFPPPVRQSSPYRITNMVDLISCTKTSFKSEVPWGSVIASLMNSTNFDLCTQFHISYRSHSFSCTSSFRKCRPSHVAWVDSSGRKELIRTSIHCLGEKASAYGNKFLGWYQLNRQYLSFKQNTSWNSNLNRTPISFDNNDNNWSGCFLGHCRRWLMRFFVPYVMPGLKSLVCIAHRLSCDKYSCSICIQGKALWCRNNSIENYFR